jgi:hypothetical protein
MKERSRETKIRMRVLAETGFNFELGVACVGDLTNLYQAVHDHPWNDAAYGGEGKEEGLGLLCPPQSL